MSSAKPTCRPWLPREDEILAEVFPLTGDVGVFKALGKAGYRRTFDAIRIRRKRFSNLRNKGK